MALMLALSEIHDRALVEFLPYGKEYKYMLKIFRTKEYVESCPRVYGRWILSEKGRQKFMSRIVNDSKHSQVLQKRLKDADDFINSL
jgi:hypothetical protein